MPPECPGQKQKASSLAACHPYPSPTPCSCSAAGPTQPLGACPSEGVVLQPIKSSSSRSHPRLVKLEQPVGIISCQHFSALMRNREQRVTKIKGTQLGQGIGVPLRWRVDASDPRHPLGHRLETHVAGQPPSVSHTGPSVQTPKATAHHHAIATTAHWQHPFLTGGMWPPASVGKFQFTSLLEDWVNKLLL